jgi:hypothetical protein
MKYIEGLHGLKIFHKQNVVELTKIEKFNQGVRLSTEFIV